MQPSNTFPNNKSYNGVLQPFVDSFFREPGRKGRFIGQEIATQRKDIKAIIAIDGESNIHLLISPAPNDVSQFNRLELRGLKVAKQNWSVAGYPSQNYLDVSCLTGTTPSFQRPFLRFAEDVLFEIVQSDILPSDAVYRTCVRWKKFWSPDKETEVTREWVYGLFGELLFLSELIKRFDPSVIDCWMGPLGKDHDFQTGTSLAVEIKTSVEIPFRINCNIRQLDPTLFDLLYVVCYRLTSSEKGITLPELVKSIEDIISKDELLLDKFYEKLNPNPLIPDIKLSTVMVQFSA